MYHDIKTKTLPEQVDYFTRKLVQISSVNGTGGETGKADQIKQWIASFPYFQKHPEYLWEQAIPGDRLGRKNIFAWVSNENASKETLIYHGHLDTVGVGDYGALSDNAFDPDQLEQYFKNLDGNSELSEEARSGDWMFGRGALDMQSGDAVHLANLLFYSEHPDRISGNLLVMFNPDEEAEHKGIITAISELKRLQEDKGLIFVGAVNSDFISPLYEGDITRYFYTGAAGKLLPSFYIYGRESHVGETLKGIDSTLVASEINRRINNNMELAEQIQEEVVLPPSCLYQRDNKEAYNVQTPFKSHLYFNYFLYEDNPKSVLEKLKQEARAACDDVEGHLRRNYKKYIDATGLSDSGHSWHLEVITLEEYLSWLEQEGIDTDRVIEQVLSKNQDTELRELSFKIVDALQQLDQEKKPRVILFYGPPHCPHHYLKPEHPQDRKIMQAMQRVANEADENESITVKRFFPFLSDSSYLSLHETDEELDSLIKNFSVWNERYSIPVRDIRALSIPAINMGVFGKDAHKWTERVYKPYSFSTLPKLIRRFTEILLPGNVHDKDREPKSGSAKSHFKKIGSPSTSK